MNKTIASLGAAAAVVIAATACSGTSETGKETTSSDRDTGQDTSRDVAPSTSVSDVFKMDADWQIPATLSEVVTWSGSDTEVLGVPTGAAPGNTYSFGGGGGTLESAYFTIEVRESSAPGLVPGQSVTVELPMPPGTPAEDLAAIDFGTSPWALAISSDGAFAGGDVVDVQDLDDQPNPTDVVGGTNATAVFAVTAADEVTLPIIDEPALESVDVTSTAGLSEELEAEIDPQN